MRLFGCLTLVIAATLTSACGGNENERRWGGGDRREAQDPLVEVVPIRRDNISRFEQSNGRIDARETADVYARVSEVATRVNVEIGDRVHKGDVLARLNRQQLEIEVASSMLNVQEAELAHRDNQLDAEKRKSELDRVLRYFDPANPSESNLFSEDAYETALLEHNRAANAVQTSRIELTRAQGELAATQLRLANTVIRAPITGYVTDRNIRENELVSESALVFRVADTRVLEVSLDIAESSLTDVYEAERLPAISMLGLGEKIQFETAQAVMLGVQAFPRARLLGYVDRVSPTVDDATGMVRVIVRLIRPEALNEELHGPLLEQIDPAARKAILDTADSLETSGPLTLRPGNWVNAHIATNVERDVLLVPGAAIVGESEVIWVVESGDDPTTGVVTSVDVSRRRGITSQGSFQLLPPANEAAEGVELTEGALIVVRGQSLLRDSQSVRVRDISE